MAQGWDKVADQHGTSGIAARRKAQHTVERAAYRKALDWLAEQDCGALPRRPPGPGSSSPSRRDPTDVAAPDGRVLDPVTGRPAADWRIATDGRLILITPSDRRSYDEMAAAHAEALSKWESVT
ncbi:hypothetical protein [Streptomyces chartreusis]